MVLSPHYRQLRHHQYPWFRQGHQGMHRLRLGHRRRHRQKHQR